jgi:hypothetical protein
MGRRTEALAAVDSIVRRITARMLEVELAGAMQDVAT